MQHKKTKVRLDHKTIVVIRNEKDFEKWKRIYPEATIIPNDPTLVPEWLKPGVQFYSTAIKDGKNVCTLLSFDAEKNTAEVEIDIHTCSSWVEPDWDLQCTIWGFENGTYHLINK